MRHSFAIRLFQGASSARLLLASTLFCPIAGHTQTWNTTASGAWDTGSNWSTGSAPTGTSATAVFGSNTASNGTNISINTAVTVGTLQFNSGAPAYNIAVNSNASLTLAGSGIVNNSSNPLTLTVNAAARVNFTGSSTAGNSILFLNSQGVIDFSGSSGTLTAGSIAASSSTNLFLGSKTLTTGSLGTSTLFQGIISDGGNSGGTGGSLVKVGSGTLTLQQNNTYTGTTTISAGVLQFGNGSSTGSVAGNVVDNASLVFDRSSALTFTGMISGSGKVTEAASGVITLGQANTYSGGTFLNAGAFLVSADNNLGAAAGGLTFNGGTLRYGAGFSSARSVLLSGAGTIDTNTFNSALSGVISGSGLLTKASAGTLTLTGTETYTGGTKITGGTLQIGSGGTAGVIIGNVTDNAAIAFNRSDNQTFASVISGSGSLSKLGTNTLTLTGGNTYSGGTTIAAGTLQIGNGGTIGSITGAVADGSALVFDHSDNVIYSGAISGSGSVTNIGTGTLIFTGANTYAGATTISAGGLQIGSGGTSGSVAGNILNNSSLTFNRSDDVTYGGVISGAGALTKLGAGKLILTGANTYTGVATISAGTLQIGNGGTTGSIVGDIVDNGVLGFNRSDDFSIASNISGTGSLVKDGAGTLTLTGTVSYSGATTILGGALLIGTGGTTGSLTGDLVVDGTLTFNRADNYLYANVISGTGSLTKLGAGTLTFTGANLYTGGTTINAGALQLGNGGTTGSIVGDVVDNSSLIFDRSDSFTLPGAISGTGSVTNLGTGSLTLSGTNAYSGGTTISAGTVTLTGANTGGGVTTIATGAALQIGSGGTTGSLAGNIVDNGTLTFNRSDNLSTSSAISGSGSVTQLGTGTLIYTGNDSHAGGTTVSAGVLQIGNGGTTGNLAGAVNVAGGTLAFNRSDDFTFSGALSGSGSLLKLGTDTMTLTGANSFTGTMTVAAGTLQGTTASLQGAIVDNGTVSLNQGSTAGTYASSISGTGSLLKQGQTVTLTGASTYSGVTNIAGGELDVIGAGASINGTSQISLAALSSANSTLVVSGGSVTTTGAVTVGSAGVGSVTIEDNGALTAGSIVLGALAGSSGTLNIGLGAEPGAVNAVSVSGGAGTASVNFNHDSASYTFAPQLTGNLSVNLDGPGATTLTAANTYTGGTNINNGTLSITSDSNLGAATGGLTINGGTLQTGGASVARAVSLGGSGGTIDTSNAASALSGVISGSGSLNIVGNGSLTLSGANTYSGGTIVTNGTLIGDSRSLQGAINNSTVVQFNQSAAGTYAGNLSGSGALIEQGGLLTLTGANTYTGATTISGIVEVSGGGVVNGTSGITVAATASSNATLQLDSALATVRTSGSLTVGRVGTGALNISSGALLTSADGTIGAIAGSIGNATVSGTSSLWSAVGQITVGGSGTGTLTVSEGGVVSANSIRLGDAAGSSGTLNIGAGGAAGTVNTAVISGGDGATSLINFNHTNPNYVFASQLGGSLAVTLAGSGTTTLTAANTYTGLTTIGSGSTLQIGNGGTTGSIVGDIVDNGILTFDRSDSFTFGGAISGTGSLMKMGAGTLTLTGTVTYSGATSVLDGALIIGNGGTSGAWNGDLSINSTLTFDRSDDLVYGFVVSGSGSVVKLGTGTLIYTGADTYTGGTTVSVGTLQIGNGGTTGSVVGNITDNANLAFDRSDAVNFGGAISGSGTLTLLGSGALTLTGSNSFTGGTVINSGTLQIGNGGVVGSLAGNVTDNGALAFNRSDNTSFAGAITGTGALSKLGAGTLTLSGNNTYNGATGISGTLLVNGGGRIEGTSGITLGQSATDQATLQVSGAGSRVTTAGSVLVGASGTGILTVDNGATVTAGSIALGSSGGGTGTLNIGSGGASGSLNATTVVNGMGASSAVNLNYTDATYTLASSLRNALTLNQNGPGVTLLTGTNTNTGGTNLNAGTLRVSSDANLGGAGNVLTFNGGTLQLGATITNLAQPVVVNAAGGTFDTGAFTLADIGTITGVGALVKVGAGTLTLSGTDSYSGGTTVSAGTLRGSTSSLQGNIVNNGTVAFLQVNDGTYTGAMSGTGGVSKLSAGNLTVTGANTYSGATSITSGTLTVNGSLSSPVTVGASGMLGGTGTLNGSVTVLGTLAPGNSGSPYGAMTVNGNVTFQAGSLFQVQTDSSGHNSAVNVSGASNAVVINGGTVNVLTGGGSYAASTQYTLLTAAGGVSGSFNGATSDFAFLTPRLSYDSTDVYLTLQRNDVPFAAVAVGKSQISVARYLDSLSAAAPTPATAAASAVSSAPSPALVQSVLNLNAPQAAKAFNDLSGTSLAELARVSMANTARLFEMLASRLGTADDSAGTGLAFSNLSTGDPRAAAYESSTQQSGTGFWARQLIADNDGIKAGGGADGFSSRGVHTAMGFDATVSSKTLVGLSAVYTRDDVQTDSSRTQPSSVRTPQLMAYASHTGDSTQLRGVVGCGEHAFESQRAVTVGPTSSLLSARHDATECSAYVQAEFGRGGSDSQLRPLLGLLYSRLDEGRYVETGGMASLAIGGHVTESVTSNTGLRFTQSFAEYRGAFEARAVWNHEFADANPTLHASLASDTGGGGFALQGAPRGRDSGVMGAGVSMRLRKSFLFHTDYNLELDSDRQVRQAVVAGLSYVY